jgi:hypothetical protein
MAHYNAHDTVDNVKRKYERRYVSGMSLDDRDVPSVCYISGLIICVRQFFPCEGIRQGEMFDMKFTTTLIGKRIN